MSARAFLLVALALLGGVIGLPLWETAEKRDWLPSLLRTHPQATASERVPVPVLPRSFWTGGGGLVAPDRPVAVLERAAWSFGKVTAGPPLVAAIPVGNAGGRRLILYPKNPGCECVAAGREPIVIPPGGCALVEIALQTRDLRGQLRTEVPYATNDPQQPRLTFQVSAEVP
jgi:hypothetical protein